ncbi:MAG TPA: YbjN domain-containing protein [Mycobacteriales bacterium]|nr:YbjN domain-containing protein [Mycobacteriales bacterium]
MTAPDASARADVIRATLRERDLQFEEPEPGAFVVRLPGTHKLATVTWLVVGDHSLHVEAFFCRRPDEAQERFYRWLLERNAKMYAVAFSVDHHGDVYIVGRLPLSAIDPDELDRVLGSVMTYSDEWFDAALEIGFRSSIEREWDWRVKRGESLANLAAFARFADPSRGRRLTDPAADEVREDVQP